MQLHWERYNRWIVTAAILLRLASEPSVGWMIMEGAQTLRTQPRFVQTMLYLGFGESDMVWQTPQAGEVTVLQPIAEEAFAPLPEPLRFTAKDSSQIGIFSTSSYDVDKLSLLNQPLAGDFSGEGAKILIVHTHASEHYADGDETVIAVGSRMESVFAAHGISVLHDTTVHDAKGYNGAYASMAESVREYLEQYPTIQMVLDVHRDAYEGANGEAGGNVVSIGGQASAQLMLVMGTDEAEGEHRNWRGNLSCALKVQAVLQRDYPRLCRDLVLRRSDYNELLTPCSMLVEVGASGNTLAEAFKAAELFAEAVCTVIEDSLA